MPKRIAQSTLNASTIDILNVIRQNASYDYQQAVPEVTQVSDIPKVGEIIDLGVEYGIIQKSGSWFSYDGQKLAQGRDAAKSLLRDNPELCDELEAKIKQAISEQAK